MKIHWAMKTVLLFLQLHVGNAASTTSVRQAIANVEQVAQDFMEIQGVPGLGLAVVAQKDDVGLQTWSTGMGWANPTNQVPATAHTAFQLASISKTILGTAIIKAQEHGYLNLSTTVMADILLRSHTDTGPLFVLGNDQIMANLENLTIEHLVTHRSTILDDDDIYACNYYVGDDPASGNYTLLLDAFGIERGCIAGVSLGLADFLQSYLSPDGVYYSPTHFLQGFQPGQVEDYSNIATGLTGYLVELATDMTLSDYVAQKIFGPLGMDHTSYWAKELMARNVAVAIPHAPRKVDGEDEYEALPLYNVATYPDGTIRSSPADMAKFMGMVLNQGTLDYASAVVDETDGNGASVKEKTMTLPVGRHEPVQLLQPDSVAEMLRPRYDDGDVGVFWITLGIPIQGQERVVVGHDGSDPGVFAYMLLDPASSTGIFLAANGGDVLGEGPRDESSLLAMLEALFVLGDELAAMTSEATSTYTPTTATFLVTELPTESPDSSSGRLLTMIAAAIVGTSMVCAL